MGVEPGCDADSCFHGAAAASHEAPKELAIAARKERDTPVADVQVRREGVTQGKEVMIGCVFHGTIKTDQSCLVKIVSSCALGCR